MIDLILNFHTLSDFSKYILAVKSYKSQTHWRTEAAKGGCQVAASRDSKKIVKKRTILHKSSDFDKYYTSFFKFSPPETVHPLFPKQYLGNDAAQTLHQ